MICTSCGGDFVPPPRNPNGGKRRSRCDACRSARDWLDGPAYRALRRQVLREEDTCHLCNRPVDTSITDRFDPWAPWIDHVIPVKLRPDLANERGNLRLAHRICNQRKGAGAARRAASPVQLLDSCQCPQDCKRGCWRYGPHNRHWCI